MSAALALAFPSRAAQAVDGLRVGVMCGVVRIEDADDTWYCRESCYDTAMTRLMSLSPVEGRDLTPRYGHVRDRGDGCNQAYTELCRMVSGPIYSLQGVSRGPGAAIAGLLAPWAVEGDEVARRALLAMLTDA